MPILDRRPMPIYKLNGGTTIMDAYGRMLARTDAHTDAEAQLVALPLRQRPLCASFARTLVDARIQNALAAQNGGGFSRMVRSPHDRTARTHATQSSPAAYPAALELVLDRVRPRSLLGSHQELLELGLSGMQSSGRGSWSILDILWHLSAIGCTAGVSLNRSSAVKPPGRSDRYLRRGRFLGGARSAKWKWWPTSRANCSMEGREPESLRSTKSPSRTVYASSISSQYAAVTDMTGTYLVAARRILALSILVSA